MLFVAVCVLADDWKANCQLMQEVKTTETPLRTVLFTARFEQWNESSKDISGGNSHGLKINFFDIPAMEGNFFSSEGCPQHIFFSSLKVGDKNQLKQP